MTKMVEARKGALGETDKDNFFGWNGNDGIYT